MTKTPTLKAELPLGTALEFLQGLWRLDRALEKLSSHMEKRIGVTAQQRLVLRCVGKYPGMMPGQLATILHVDPGTVSAALNRLEHKQLIVRRRDPNDKRRVALMLSARGRALDVPSRHTVEAAVEDLIGSSTAAELRTTRVLLAKLTDLIDAAHDDAAPRKDARLATSRSARGKR